MPMPVYVIVPTNDRGKSVSRITVRTTQVGSVAIAGPKRDCATIDADLSLDSARLIARWAIANLSLEHVRELRDLASERLGAQEHD
jgi:hypothetical protein